MEGRRLSLTVTEERAGTVVDTLLRRELGLSGTSIKRAKAVPGGILLDGRPVTTAERVAAGQSLTVFVGDLNTGGVVPADHALDILYEDDDLLLVNKEPGMTVHPGPGRFDNTLGNFVAGYYKKRGVCAAFHPVNRLDKGTSGLMAVAKYAHAQDKLIQQLHTGAFRRSYLALCEGTLGQLRGCIDAPIGREEGSAIRRQVRPDGLPARTHYRVLESYAGRSLLALELETGRTHQIRVHMAYLGYPLTGDFLYGREDRTVITRPALHSVRLELLHPITGECLTAEAALPEDMARLVSSRKAVSQICLGDTFGQCP